MLNWTVIENVKTYIKIYMYVVLHVSVYNHHQGVYSLCFAKVIIIRIVS